MLCDQEWAGTEECVQWSAAEEAAFIEALLAEPLATSLITRGYAVVPFGDDPDVEATLSEFYSALADFCHLDIEDKVKFATTTTPGATFTPDQIHGYSQVNGLKEQFMIRAQGPQSTLISPVGSLPSHHFGRSALQLYLHMDSACRRILHTVATHSHVPISRVNEILDPECPSTVDKHKSISVIPCDNPQICVCSTESLYPHYISTSLLDVFHYINQFQDKSNDERFVNNHASHSDSGILTLVPLAPIPGLEVRDLSSDQWLPLEAMLQRHLTCSSSSISSSSSATSDTLEMHNPSKTRPKRVACVFFGDSIRYLLPQQKPCMHRVARCTAERYSLVYKMRTMPAATAPRYQEDYFLAVLQQNAVAEANRTPAQE